MVEAGMTATEAKKSFVVCTSKGTLGRADGSKGDPNHKRGLTVLTQPVLSLLALLVQKYKY
jgi:hypothetical protein